VAAGSPEAVDELAQRTLRLFPCARDDSRPFFQVVITVNAMMPMSSGSQAPCTNLSCFAARNIRSHQQEQAAYGQHDP